MGLPRLSRMELTMMEALWSGGALSIREIQERFPAGARPAYATVQTMVYRLERKQAMRRVRKIGNAHIFAAAVSRNRVHRRLLDELLGIFGGRTQPIMAHWIETGQLRLEDVQEAEKEIRRLSKKGKPAKRSAGLGPRGPQAGVSKSGTPAAGGQGPAPTI